MQWCAECDKPVGYELIPYQTSGTHRDYEIGLCFERAAEMDADIPEDLWEEHRAGLELELRIDEQLEAEREGNIGGGR